MMQSENRGFPEIDVVIIGVNAAKTVGDCLKSVDKCDYPVEKIHIFYVDGGSCDNSIQVARGFQKVEVIELSPDTPTPGLGRNAGWQAGQAPLVQFLDADTLLDSGWLKKAVAAMSPDVTAVCGFRRELCPDRSYFNWVADLEWNGPPGECEAFGGDVLIRREALEQTQGYDEVLVGGEDPELSQRIRRLGGRILRLDQLMTSHDIKMTKISQYLKRAYRTGYGYAAVAFRHLGIDRGFFFEEFRRIIIRGGGSLLLLSLALLLGIAAHPLWLMLSLLGLPLVLYPRLFSIDALMREKGLNRKDAKKYAWNCSLVVLPQFFGILRYLFATMYNAPLRNNKA